MESFKRLCIWDLDCGTMNIVLSACMSPAEMKEICHRFDWKYCKQKCLPQDYRLATALHHASHEKNPISIYTQRCLAGRYQAITKEHERTSPQELLQVYLNLDETNYALGALVWALATDPRSELASLKLYFFSWILSRGIRNLTASIPQKNLTSKNSFSRLFSGQKHSSFN